MKVLLTGASGYIGSRILNALCQQYGQANVVVLSSKPHEHCDFVLYDSFYNISSSDIDRLQDIKVIIHAGAFIPKSRVDANNVNHCNGNVLFTHTLLNTPFPSLKQIIYLSTVDVYGDDEVISESTSLAPNSLYGSSKLYCENMITAFSKERNVSALILRVGHVYGPGEDEYEKLIPNTIKSILQGREVEIWGEGNEIRTFIYVDDVVRACLSSVERCPDIPIINLVGNQAVSIIELVNSLVEVAGVRVSISHKQYTGMQRDLYFDNTLMRQYLIEPSTPLIQGLAEEVAYFKEKK